MNQLPVRHHPDLLVGMETGDDAGVFRLDENTALIQTLDFFTPIVDTPYEFGQIAAANALSDVYAMGGIPLTAMNIVCFPVNDMPQSILNETMAGGLSKIYEADAVLAGGHSVDDVEFKYGLSVTGRVHPQRVLTNATARYGDVLILTKPIGTGIIATAVKGRVADASALRTLIRITSTLNKYAADIMCEFSPSACTDITGFGFAGHLLEMARGSKKEIQITSGAIPCLEKALEYARMGLIPAGCYDNKRFCETDVTLGPSVDTVVADLIFDPQTSGGLVFSLPEKYAEPCLRKMQDNGIEAVIVGEIINNHSCGFVRII